MKLFNKKNLAKKAVFKFAIALFLSATMGLMAQPMNGTYTVCASGCNFSSIAQAANALNTNGVSGAVTIDIGAGTYTAQVAIGNLTGASSTNTVTFSGAGAGSTIISGTSLQLVNLSNAKFITFEDMSIINTSTSTAARYGIYAPSSSNIMFKNCDVNVPSTTSGPVYGMYFHTTANIVIQGCSVKGGYYGIMFNQSSSPASNFKLLDNSITEYLYYGVYMQPSNSGANAGGTGNVLSGNYSESKLKTQGYGFYIYYSNGLKFTNNVGISGVTGIYLSGNNYAAYNGTDLVEITNNMAVGGHQAGTIWADGKTKISHNSFHNSNQYPAATVNSGAIIIYTTSTVSYLEVSNNNFTSETTSGKIATIGDVAVANGNAYHVTGNNYYNPNGFTVRYQGVNYTNPGDFVAASGDNHARNQAITYVDTTDLHLASGSTPAYSPYIAGVTKDFDGTVRDQVFPTIGADEGPYFAGPMLTGKNITVFLDSNGEAHVDASDVHAGSADRNGITAMTLSRENFDCSDRGPNQVTLTVYNASNDSASATCTVTIVDNSVPNVLVDDLTIYLDETGQATLTAGDVDAGSTDNCEIVSRVLNGHATSAFNLASLATASSSHYNYPLDVLLNDGNYGTCGTDEMWVYTNPLSSTAGVDYLQFDWTTEVNFDKFVIHHGTTTTRFLTGGMIQVWDGSAWVNHHHFTNLTPACSSIIAFDAVKTTKVRITLFEMTAAGQKSNPGFREIEIVEVPGFTEIEYTCADLGTHEVELFLKDPSGNFSSNKANITIAMPEVTVASMEDVCMNNGTISLASGSPSGGTYSGTGVTNGVFDPAAAGAGTHTITYTINYGACTASSTGTIEVYSTPTANAGSNTTVYYGYSSMASATLSGSATGGSGTYSYSWNTGATTSSITVSPTTTTTYTLTVTDANGCSHSDEVTVYVVDVRCGNNMDKVLVCHNGNVICVSASAVAAHLNHGCNLGSCHSLKKEQEFAEEVIHPEHAFTAYPNPFRGTTNIEFTLAHDATVSLEVYDMKGAKVVTLYKGESEADQVHRFEFNGSAYGSSVYLVKMVSGTEVKYLKIIMVE